MELCAEEGVYHADRALYVTIELVERLRRHPQFLVQIAAYDLYGKLPAICGIDVKGKHDSAKAGKFVMGIPFKSNLLCVWLVQYGIKDRLPVQPRGKGFVACLLHQFEFGHSYGAKQCNRCHFNLIMRLFNAK